jgi:hypothetical protein
MYYPRLLFAKQKRKGTKLNIVKKTLFNMGEEKMFQSLLRYSNIKSNSCIGPCPKCPVEALY